MNIYQLTFCINHLSLCQIYTMIFNRSYNFKSSKTIAAIKQCIAGSHLKVHSFDFEGIEVNNVLKIIPHAENSEGITTLPITNIHLSEKNNKTSVHIETHPRRIDIGGPYILVVLCLALFFAGFFIGLYGGIDQTTTSKIMMGIGLGVFVLFWIKMELGYFDYVRKIKAWVKQQV
jgi:hypothetical protein